MDDGAIRQHVYEGTETSSWRWPEPIHEADLIDQDQLGQVDQQLDD